MAAAAGGVNFVRFFFYAGNTISPSRKKALVALAYATARDQQLAPKAILIRSDMHDTTTAGGQHVKDPKGWHGTFRSTGNSTWRRMDTQMAKRTSSSRRQPIPRRRRTVLLAVGQDLGRSFGHLSISLRNTRTALLVIRTFLNKIKSWKGVSKR
ncbi:hypothetical protein VTN31DRAFT_5343 [Thermomyces dupontii]|uniref:uncharacterized protein n=1 Tax=Talaromyces thermophilus TaxID=28565 RepID=UPI003743772C